MARRLVLFGGRGFFGRTLLELLDREAVAPPRREVDADDASSLRSLLRPGDVVVDAAGPYQARTPALVDAVLDTGCDLIDLNDSLAYAEQVLSRTKQIEEAGIKVLTSCSSVSTIAACVVKRSGIGKPVSVTGFIAPATRHTANPGSARSLVRSVGQRVRVLRDGRLVERRGWSESRRFPMPVPVGSLEGFLFESADSVWLPRIWPSLRTVEVYVDTNTPGLNRLLGAAAGRPWLRRTLERSIGFGSTILRLLGARAGGLGYEIEDARGRCVRAALVAGETGRFVPVAAAVVAAREMLAGGPTPCGLVPPDRQVDSEALFAYLDELGVTLTYFEPPR